LSNGIRSAGIGACYGRRAAGLGLGLLVLAALGSLAEDAARWQVTRGDVRVVCALTVGGSFEARTASLEGALSVVEERGPLLAGALTVALGTLDSGIGLRDDHLRHRYLEVTKGEGYDKAVLSDIRLGDVDARSFQGRTTFTATLALHGQSRPVAGEAEVRREAGSARVVVASFPVTLGLRDSEAAVPGRRGEAGGPGQGLAGGRAGRLARRRVLLSGKGLFLLAGLGPALVAAPARAEPMFLSRQYARCTTCHYSPTGGGLLTPYGRSLSRQELSTTGRSPSGSSSEGGPETTSEDMKNKEEAFLFGLLGDKLGHADLGFDTRPAYLGIDAGGFTSHQDFFMNADLLATYRQNGWTVYGEIGRQPRPEGTKIDSYEYWVGYQATNGLGVRAGRFLPAYGIRLADHTAFTRAGLGFDVFDQLYGLELSRTTERHLLQVSVGPGRADSILEDDGRRAFTATGRFQTDFGPKTALVVSGLYRAASRLEEKSGAGGVAFGFSPARRLNLWTEADAQVQKGQPGPPAYTLLNETAFEIVRGVWLKLSPQIRTAYDNAAGGTVRTVFEVELFPRTHWNVDVAYYRDRARVNDLVTKTLLAQLHLYL
jgi:hypothetical protein